MEWDVSGKVSEPHLVLLITAPPCSYDNANVASEFSIVINLYKTIYFKPFNEAAKNEYIPILICLINTSVEKIMGSIMVIEAASHMYGHGFKSGTQHICI